MSYTKKKRTCSSCNGLGIEYDRWAPSSKKPVPCFICKGTKKMDVYHGPKSRPVVWNYTKYDTKILEALVAKAVKRAECDPNIHVIILPSKRTHHGIALPRDYYTPKVDVPRRKAKGLELKRWKTNQGLFKIWIPTDFSGFGYRYCVRDNNEWVMDEKGSRTFAETFYGMLVHEAKHVADMQTGLVFGDYKRRWKNRPHEIRAIITENGAKAELRRGDNESVSIIVSALAKNLLDESTRFVQSKNKKRNPFEIREMSIAESR